jgi:hypothetical protein
VWEYPLTQPIARLSRGMLTASVRDRQGNLARVQRTFSAGK